MKTIGIIGAGHMAGALLKGLLTANYIDPKRVVLSGGRSGTAETLARELGCVYTADNAEVAQNCDTLILGVIPKMLPTVLEEIKSYITSDQLIISIAASYTFKDFYNLLPSSTQVVRTIPNLPVELNAGITAIATNSVLTDANFRTVNELFKAVGEVLVVNEAKLEVASAVAGCSPAFYAMFIEALADAGVLYGLGRNESYLLAKHAALGTAKTLLKDNMLPAALKDGVASPGGTTIKGIAALEEHGLRNAVIQAVKAATGN